MNTVLSRLEKIRLINGIELMQQERWKRIKRFHNIDGLDMTTKHLFMQKDINLMRRQKARLHELKASVYQ